MADGPGVDPISDIVTYWLPVFPPLADQLIAEIVALGGRLELDERYGAFYWSPPSFTDQLDSLHPIPADLENELVLVRDRLEYERRNGGWEVDRLLTEARAGRDE